MLYSRNTSLVRVDLAIAAKSEISQYAVAFVVHELEEEDESAEHPVEVLWPIVRLRLEEENLNHHKKSEHNPVME